MTKPRLFKFALFFILIGNSLFLESCKKGDDDPFISFRSRRTRLVGEWNYTKITVNNDELFNNSLVSLTFEKNGTGVQITKNSFGQEFKNDIRWNFLNKGDGFKNKERVVIYNQYDPAGIVYEVLELRNDKIVMGYQNRNDYYRFYFDPK